MLIRFIEFIRDEWSTISSVRYTFIILLLVAFLVAFPITFSVSSWYYRGVIDSLREQLSVKNERINAKDDQLTEYRERLHLTPSDTTEFTEFANKELREKALNIVQELRTFLTEKNRIQSDILFSGWRHNIKDLSEEEQHKAFNEETKRIMMDSLKTSTDYDTRFKVDTILLRDELSSRLPEGSKNEREYRMYEHPTNLLGMAMIADDIERMAKLLPVSKTK